MDRLNKNLPLSRYTALHTTEPRVALERSVMFSDTRSVERLHDLAPFELMINSTTIANLRLSAIASSGHKVEVFDKDFLTVIIPTRGLIRVEADRVEVKATANSVLLTGARHRLTVVSPSYAAITVQIPRNMLDAKSTLGPSYPIELETIVQPARASPAEPLFEFIQFLMQEIERRDLSRTSKQLQYASKRLLADLVVRAYQAASDTDGNIPLAAAPWQAERAAAYMRSNYREHLSISEVAAAAGTGTRALQLAFRKRFGIAPRTYLENIRLTNVRRRLLSVSTDDSVTILALECGFTHLGRFSRAYFKAYGELPSESLTGKGTQRLAARGHSARMGLD